jgi:K+-transporting ATPase ATPase C chain
MRTSLPLATARSPEPGDPSAPTAPAAPTALPPTPGGAAVASAGGLLRPALLLLALLSLLTGLAYPLVVTGAARVLFPAQAGGSLVRKDGRVVGSALIGQAFDDPAYFWGRPSATAPTPYNAAASTGSNLGPTNPALAEAIRGRVAALRAADAAVGVASSRPVPVDLVTASGSGLDPELSPAAAFAQVPRVAAARRVPEERVRHLVESRIEDRDRKSTRLNSSHNPASRMPSSA